MILFPVATALLARRRFDASTGSYVTWLRAYTALTAVERPLYWAAIHQQRQAALRAVAPVEEQS